MRFNFYDSIDYNNFNYIYKQLIEQMEDIDERLALTKDILRTMYNSNYVVFPKVKNYDLTSYNGIEFTQIRVRLTGLKRRK